MRQTWSVTCLLLASATIAQAGERNYTLRGDGWFDGANQRFARLPMREVRMTIRDNGEFAVTLFVRNERYLVRGRWDRRGRARTERIDIAQAFGVRASGRGTLQYRGDGRAPERLVLDGRTEEGDFRAEITEERSWGDWNDPRDHADRRRYELGRGDRLHEDLDLMATGDGLLRMAGVRDGRVSAVRAILRTNREVRIQLERPTRGEVRGEVVDIRDTRVRVRVTEVLGVRASGEVDLVVDDRRTMERISGAGSSREGSWQLDFDGRRGPRERGDWEDGRWLGAFERSERGSGRLRQDEGPDVTFDRLRVRLEPNRDAFVVLEGRRQSIEFRGRWRDDGREVRIDLARVNEMRASGRLTLERDGNRVRRLAGEGRTERGRFDLRFAP